MTEECAPCRQGRHRDCDAGDSAREEIEAEWHFDCPPPLLWCSCDCEGGTILTPVDDDEPAHR